VYSSFKFRSYENPTNIVFLINIYEFNDSNGKKYEKLVGSSYYKVNKALLNNCSVDIDLSLLNGSNILGSLKG